MNVFSCHNVKSRLWLHAAALALIFSGVVHFEAIAGNTAIKNTNAIKSSHALRAKSPLAKSPLYENDTALENHEIALCLEYLSLVPNSRYNLQKDAGVASADYGDFSLLGDKTTMQFQTQPAQRSRVTKTTESTTSGNTTTTTEASESQNSAAFAQGQIIDVALNHRTGVVLINGQIADAFQKRMIQEDCRRAIRK